jgi:hypothetical protein
LNSVNWYLKTGRKPRLGAALPIVLCVLPLDR